MHFNRDSLIFLPELPKKNKSKKVQVGNDKEMGQSKKKKKSHSKTRGRKKLN